MLKRTGGLAAGLLLAGGLLLAAGLMNATVAIGASAPVAQRCEVPAELLQIDVTFAHLRNRLRAGQPATIVAIGGGSTRGAAAGSLDLAYPSRLQEALAAAFPKVAITVLNKGMPRQTARQMLSRFPRDVLAQRPALVLWEAGTTDAVEGIEVDDFAEVLEAGLAELRRRGIDVMLIDMQFSRHTASVIDFERYVDAMHRVGDLYGVYVFPRYEMMRYWREENMFDFSPAAGSARGAVAARLYQCIGQQLAHVIRLAVR